MGVTEIRQAGKKMSGQAKVEVTRGVFDPRTYKSVDKDNWARKRKPAGGGATSRGTEGTAATSAGLSRGSQPSLSRYCWRKCVTGFPSRSLEFEVFENISLAVLIVV